MSFNFYILYMLQSTMSFTQYLNEDSLDYNERGVSIHMLRKTHLHPVIFIYKKNKKKKTI